MSLITFSQVEAEARKVLSSVKAHVQRSRSEAVSFEERRTRPREQWGDGGWNPTISERRTGTASVTPDVLHALTSARDALLLGCRGLAERGFALDAINGVLKRAGWVWFQAYRVDPRNPRRTVRDGPPVLVAPDSVQAKGRPSA